MLRHLVSDFLYALRTIRRTPSFTIGVIAVLALGIGANTAIFSIVNAVLLRPLPFEQPGRLVQVFQTPPQDAFPGIDRFAVSPANFYDWKRDATRFDSMAIYRLRQLAVTGGGSSVETIRAGAVETDFFRVLRAQPALGRLFLPEEDAPERSRVVVLSDGFWKRQFGASADVLGRTISLDGNTYTIVGVAAPRISFAAWPVASADVWIPLAYTATAKAVRENHNAAVVARLKDDDVTQAQSEMNALSARLDRDYPKENAGWGAVIVPLHEAIVGDTRTSLVVLVGAVGLILLIACANVGNLLFARALARRKELMIRAALGAGRARVFQHLLVESLLLALMGGAAGLLLADVALSAAASALLATGLPRANEVAIDMRVLLFAGAVSVLAGVLAGTLPALRAGRTDITEALKEGGRHDDSLSTTARRLLVVGEVALSLVVLMSAGVMLRTLDALGQVDAGFDPRNVLTMRVSLPNAIYATPESVRGYLDAALQRIRALPGVVSVGAVDDLPVQGGSVQPVVPEGKAELLPRDQPTVAVRRITPGYLQAMRIPLVRGRDVAEGDRNVLLVSWAAAKLLWGSTDPIGSRATFPLQSRTLSKDVIGVVGDVKQGELSEPMMPTIYQYTRDHDWRQMAIVVRTSVPPLSVAEEAAATLRTLDPNQPIQEIQTMEDVVGETLMPSRFTAMLLALFAGCALLLAAIGLYSLLSYIVRGRSREIGIRSALGAQRSDVLQLIVRQGVGPALIGVAAGIAATFASARMLETLVFGVSASDPLTLAVTTGALLFVATIACIVPAHRATRLDPVTVLRD